MRKILLFTIILLCSGLSAQTPDYTDRETYFTVATGSAPPSLDILHAVSSTEAQIFTNLHEGLVSYHPGSLEPLPAISDKWVISPDGKTYTFHIRETAKFSNSDPITAKHVRDSLMRVLNPANKAAYASLLDLIVGATAYRSGKGKEEDVGIKVLGEDLVITLNDAAGHFLRLLTHPSFGVIHPDLASSSDKKSPTLPVSGAYMVSEFSKSQIHLVPNPNYWDANNVKMPNIIFFFDLPAKTATEMYNMGRIHWICGDFDYDSFRKAEDIVFNQTFSSHFFYFSSRIKPFDKVEVRKALAGLIDWKKIKALFRYPAEGLVPPVVPGYPEVKGVSSLAKEEALKLLEQAGFPNGAGLPEITIFVWENSLDHDGAKIIKESLESALPVSVKIIFPTTDYFYGEEQDNAVMSSVTWIADYPDPYSFLELWKSDSSLNYALYQDEEYDRLLNLAMKETGNKRYKLLGDAEKKLLADSAIFPVSYSAALNAMDTGSYLGWFANLLDIHPLKFLDFLKYPLPWGITKLTKPQAEGGT